MRASPRWMSEPAFEAPQNWTDVTLINSWLNYDSGYSRAGYFVDELGWVCLRGLVKNAGSIGSTSVMFVLPMDLRPVHYELWPAHGSCAGIVSTHRVDVYDDGNVGYVPRAVGVVDYLSLANIRFKPNRDGKRLHW